MRSTLDDLFRIFLGTLKISAVLDVLAALLMLLSDEPMGPVELLLLLVVLMLTLQVLTAVPYILWRIFCLVFHREADLDDFRDGLLVLPVFLFSAIGSLLGEAMRSDGDSSSGTRSSGHRFSGSHSNSSHSSRSFGGGSSRGGSTGRKF